MDASYKSFRFGSAGVPPAVFQGLHGQECLCYVSTTFTAHTPVTIEKLIIQTLKRIINDFLWFVELLNDYRRRPGFASLE